MDRALLDRLREARAARRAVAVVTELASGAQRLVARGDASGDAELDEHLAACFGRDRSRTVEIGGRETFLHIHNPPLKMIVVGAVHMAQELIPIAGAAGYDVTIIDPRGAFATEARFPGVELVAEWPDEVMPGLGIDHRSAVLALTHDPKIDDPALTFALASECFYIGALGSRKTHAGRVERLKAHGLGDDELARIHAPIGLAIGAQGPAEIAISIMAEVTSVLRLGGGGEA
jgi:xanthine dehydrogenase accessory factor